MWASSLWRLHLRADRLNLWVPVPLYVVRDLLLSMEDLGAVILPRLGMPNYPAVLRDLVEALLSASGEETLIDVHAGDVRIALGPLEGGV